MVSLKHYCGFQRDFSAENRSAWKIGHKNLAAVNARLSFDDGQDGGLPYR